MVNKKGELIQLHDGRGAIAVKEGRARAVTSADFKFGRAEANRLAFNLGNFSCSPDKEYGDWNNRKIELEGKHKGQYIAHAKELADKYRQTYGLDFPAKGLSHHMGWVEANYVNDSDKQKTCAGVLHAFMLPKDLQPIAKGTVFLLHGLLGHTGFLPNMIKDLISNGYNVVSLDWPGHGLSVDGKRAGIDSFEAYQAVLEKSMEAIKPMLDGKPLHMVTHSTGGAIGLDYMSKSRTDADPKCAVNGGMVNIAPLFHPAVPKKMTPIATGMSRFITWITRKDRTLKPGPLGKTALLRISSDLVGNHPERKDIALARDRRMTTKWQKAWSVWINKMRGREEEPKPDGSRIKILGAAEDKIVNTQAGKKHYQSIFSGLQHEVIPGSYHAMHMDGNTYQDVMTKVIQHLNQHSPDQYDSSFWLSSHTSEV